MTALTHTRIAPVLGAIALLTGALVPIAGANIRDGRSPDTRDAASAIRLDLRAPDTTDAATQARAIQPAHDLRSPDTRDSATAATVTRAPVVVVTENPGFDWTDAGIGAAGGFAVALLLVGMTILAGRGRGGSLAT
jgi:hypothetical protein